MCALGVYVFVLWCKQVSLEDVHIQLLTLGNQLYTNGKHFTSTTEHSGKTVTTLCTTLNNIFFSSLQTVQVTPPFLGAVTALSWVCTLPTMMSSVTPPTCNDDIITMATTGDMQSPLLTQQNLSGCHGDQFELATSISRLPLNLVVVKPVLPAAEGGRSLTGGVVETDEEEGKGYFGVTASKRKTEWGPLITHCYTCYWKCVLFSLQRLHPRPISSEKMGGASLMLSQSSDIIDTPFSSPSTLSDPAKNLSGIISSVGAKGPAVPIGSNDMNVIIEVCLGSLDLLDEGLSSAIDSLTALLPEVRTNKEKCVCCVLCM